jgi:Zn-dependent oligopeptidase
MFKLIKFSLLFCLVIAGGYLLLGITFGNKTLYQHLVTISETDEAQTLKSEIGKKVDHATEDIRKKAAELAIDGVKEKLEEVTQSRKGTQTETISASDKNRLQSLIKEKEQAANRDEEKAAKQHADRLSLNRLIHQKNQESP